MATNCGSTTDPDTRLVSANSRKHRMPLHGGSQAPSKQLTNLHSMPSLASHPSAFTYKNYTSALYNASPPYHHITHSGPSASTSMTRNLYGSRQPSNDRMHLCETATTSKSPRGP